MAPRTLLTRAGLAVGLVGSTLLAVADMGPVPQAHAASSCSALLTSQINFLQNTHLGYFPRVEVQITTNEPLRHFTSYATGRLKQGLVGADPALVSDGSAKAYFSDRTYASTGAPFDNTRTDWLSLNFDTVTGAVNVTLQSWGNTLVSVPVTTCDNGALYGFDSSGYHALWTATFKDVYYQITL